MKSVDYNIEFAHIYVDKKFGKEQKESINVLKRVLRELEDNKKSYSTCILIDEFSTDRIIIDEEEFLESVRMNGGGVDYLAYESELSKFVDKLILDLPKSKVKRETFVDGDNLLLISDGRKVGLKDGKNRPSCSLLIAVWILCRFGIYELPGGTKKFSNKPFSGKRLITILPKKYKKTEHKVWSILENTKFKDYLKKMDYRFF